MGVKWVQLNPLLMLCLRPWLPPPPQALPQPPQPPSSAPASNSTHSTGMSTTQRIESIHHFFKGFLKSSTTLREFVSKYTRAIDYRMNAEKTATANDERNVYRPMTKFPLYESYFRVLYTGAKFKEVVEQITELQCCTMKSECAISNLEKEFVLLDRWQVGDPPMTISKELKLVLHTDTLEMRCDCRLFQHRGIMCRHMFRVMVNTEMSRVPERYVLERWRKDIKRNHLDVKVSFNDPSKTQQEIRYGRLQYEFEAVFQAAFKTEELCEHAIESARQLLNDLVLLRSSSTDNETSTGVGTEVPSIQGSNETLEGLFDTSLPDDPIPRKRIGRPPSKSKHAFDPKKRRTTSSNGSSERSVTGSQQLQLQSLPQQGNPLFRLQTPVTYSNGPPLVNWRQ